MNIRKMALVTLLSILACANSNAGNSRLDELRSAKPQVDADCLARFQEKYDLLVERCIESSHNSFIVAAIKNVFTEALCLAAAGATGYAVNKYGNTDAGVVVGSSAIGHTLSRIFINRILGPSDSSLKNLRNLNRFLDENLQTLNQLTPDEIKCLSNIFDKDFLLISQRISDYDILVNPKTESWNSFFEKKWVKLDALLVFIGVALHYILRSTGKTVSEVLDQTPKDLGTSVCSVGCGFVASAQNAQVLDTKLNETPNIIFKAIKDNPKVVTTCVAPLAYYLGLLIVFDVIMYGKDAKTEKRELLRKINILFENKKLYAKKYAATVAAK